MALMTWKDEYSVGVAEFDEDHRNLLNIINDLDAALAQGDGMESVMAICDRLVTHTVQHFEHEEARFTGYPGAEAHRRMHEKLKERVAAFRQQLGTPAASSSAKLVTDWLAHHITGEDKKFGAWLNTQGIH